MSSRIPKRFDPLIAAVKGVADQLKAAGQFEALGPGRWIWDLDMGWAEPVEHVAFVLDTDGPLLAVYVVIQLAGVGDRSDALATAITRANYGLLPGSFELDVETGETRYRSVLLLISNDLEAQPVAQLLADALLMAQTYAPAFTRIVESDADPIAAVDEIEAGI